MLTVYILTIISALIFQAFFTASEMALTSVNRIRLKVLVESKDPYALRLNEFLSKKGMFLGTTLVGTNICVIIASTLTTRIFAEYFDKNISALLTTVALVPVTLVCAEIVPKMIGRHFSTGMALRTVAPLNNFRRLLSPVIIAVTSVAKFLLAPFVKQTTPWEMTFTKTDLKKIVLSGREAGEVETDEAELIHRVLDFGAKPAGDIMVPLYRVSSISADDSIANLKKLVSLTGFSRIPVYMENKDAITGIVNIYDILFVPKGGDEEMKIADFIREPVYISKGDGLDIVLTHLRRKKQPMGIVVAGGQEAVGIVTIEDILEELVGEIEDGG